MTQTLPILLESVQHADGNRRKELAKKIDPTLMWEFADGTKKSVRELILTDDNTSTTLVQAEVYNTVIEGAMPAVSMRNALDVIQVKSNSLRVNYGTSGAYANEVDEAAEIPVEINTYTPATFNILKYGARPLISRELVNDGLFDVVNEEIKYAGRKLELALNRKCLSDLLEGSGNEWDTTTTSGALGVKAIAKAIGVNKAAGFTPTDVIMHPQAEAFVLMDYIPTGANYQIGNATTTGYVPAPVLGLKAHTCGIADNSSTYIWEYDTDGDIGMMVIDRAKAGKIAMREDITVQKYDDPIHDLMGMSCTMRFGYSSIISTAATRIEY